ncbi:hypothetical protein KIL84_013905 [Mauremys mutica]|uniref:Uncharacterized protein n=1 Tax=Mauremys mutica TaxID=74926 RepID=A0A9D3WYI9_9SAUR|nr:hypothetical protein KIL84_013905 [Mauremys mutica]
MELTIKTTGLWGGQIFCQCPSPSVMTTAAPPPSPSIASSPRHSPALTPSSIRTLLFLWLSHRQACPALLPDRPKNPGLFFLVQTNTRGLAAALFCIEPFLSAHNGRLIGVLAKSGSQEKGHFQNIGDFTVGQASSHGYPCSGV